MKRSSITLLAILGLSACGDYQGPKANCFYQNSVTRSETNLSFLPTSGGRLSTSTAPVSDCMFVGLGSPVDTGG